MINYFTGKYADNFERRLGLRKEDLLNDMREQIWKGLLTYNPKAKSRAAKRNYLYQLVLNRFKTLLERSNKRKYSLTDYYADVWATAGIDRDLLETDETPETVFAAREAMLAVTFNLTDFERRIYVDLMYGRSLDEMSKRHKTQRVKVIAAINRIDKLMKDRT